MTTTGPTQQPVSLSVEQALRQAVALLQAGQLRDAERLYRAILQARTNHPDANHNLGALAVQAKQPASGLRHTPLPLESNPREGQYWLSFVDALIKAGQVELAQQALDEGRQRGLQGEPAEELANCLAEIVPHPQERNALLALYAEERYTEAAALAEQLTARFPQNGFAWKALGTALNQMGRNAAALNPMRRAVALSPGDPEAHNNSGKILHALGRLDESEASCRRALEIKPDLAEAHYNLGGTLHALGRLDEAETGSRRALSVKPDYAEAHVNLGNILHDLGRLDEAEASCRQALEANRDYAEAHNNLGNVLHDLGQLADAETSYRRALEIKPNFAEAYLNVGTTLKDLGRLDDAEVTCRRALRVEPENALMHFGLGDALKELGRPDAAEAHFRSCLEIDPEDSLGTRLLLASLGLEPLPGRTSAAQLDKLYVERSHTWGMTEGYVGHKLVAQALRKLAHHSKLDILDAGCGTGLVGSLVRDLADRLVGIDMSPAMLRKASGTGIYDQIHQADLVSFMLDNQNSYDAVVCAATLIHFGDLAPAFDAAAACLRDGGLFVLTLFPNENPRDHRDVIVAQNTGLARGGCYAHSPSYIIRLADTNMFDVEMLDIEIHEYHNRTVPVMGLVVALRRRARSHSLVAPSDHSSGRLEAPSVGELSSQDENALVTLFAEGQYTEAATLARTITTRLPQHGFARKVLGAALQKLGRDADALRPLQEAAALSPDDAEAHSNLGVNLKSLGCLAAAEICYRRALRIKPDYADALKNLALLLLAQDKPMMALDTIKQSLQMKETAVAKNIFVACVKRLRFAQDDSELRVALVRALTEPWGRPDEVARAGASLVKFNPDVAECVRRAADAWPLRLAVQDLFGPNGAGPLAADLLLCALLNSAPICDIEIERFLTMARHALLDTATGMAPSDSAIDSALSFFSALARQCFINEYVFSHTDDEIQKASVLRDSLIAALATTSQVPVPWLLAVAAYFPLSSLPLAARLLDFQWSDAVSAVLVQQVREPADESRLRATIARLTKIEDEVSLLVQGQYEENPYPRWVKAAPGGKAKSIFEYLRQKFPLASFEHHRQSDSIDLLIAGCGTGQQPIETMQAFQDVRVLAVDLSMASLSYAKRKTLELGLTSIEYAQADLLKLGSLGRSFDVIESVGVLHHLADPLAGWLVLLSLLRPGGFMYLGLYSEVARRNIVKARTFIAEQGYESTANEIRRCRQDLMGPHRNAEFATLLKSPDFFSISTCRDLLFHVQEHRLTLTKVDTFLRNNNLAFLGFEIGANVLRAYKLRFPNDHTSTNLSQWQVFESENPDTFFGMYHFWVQKKG